MSEYQYYEFRAIDRLLTNRQMQELRTISTRAAISRTSFSNYYTFGDLKANSRDLLCDRRRLQLDTHAQEHLPGIRPVADLVNVLRTRALSTEVRVLRAISALRNQRTRTPQLAKAEGLGTV